MDHLFFISTILSIIYGMKYLSIFLGIIINTNEYYKSNTK